MGLNGSKPSRPSWLVTRIRIILVAAVLGLLLGPAGQVLSGTSIVYAQSNSAPSVSRVSPSSSVSIYAGDSQTFTASASDPDNDLKRGRWLVNNQEEDSFIWRLFLPSGTETRDFTHTFSTAGTHTVEVEFTDTQGLSDSVSWTVTVRDPSPSVSRVSPSSSIDLGPGDIQTFWARASDPNNDLAKWKWEARRDRGILPDFVYTPGEQSFGTAPTGSVTKDFTYTFADDGDWTVKVTFTDSGGLSDSVSWDVDVEYSTPSVSRVSPSSSSLDIGIGDRRTFRARADDDDDDLSKWKWEARRARTGPDFVYTPGEQSFGTAPTGSVTKDFAYTFEDEGEWTVRITFTDAEGLSDSEEWDVDVENSDPSVDRVSPRRSIDLGLGDSQTFMAEADDDDDNLSKWKWEARRARTGPDFVYSPGEQSFTTAPTGSVTKDFTYTFAEEGEWTVEVTFTDAERESDSVEWDVDVENRAPSVSRVSPYYFLVDLDTGDSQTFRASAEDDDNNLSKWKWEARRHRIGLDFVYTPGEQSFSTSPTGSVTKDFSYTFSTAGSWTVTATFTDAKGESDSEEWEVTVNIAPSVSIVSPSSPVSIYSGDSQTFTASASDSDNNLKSYEWFVDGTSEDDHTWLILPTGTVTEDFTHTFSTAGPYKVKVTFTDAVGDSDSEEWTVRVRDPASPSVSRVSPSTPVSLDTGDSQTFRASAEDDDDDLSKWKWEAKRDRIGPDFVYTPGEQSFSTSPTGSVTKDFSYTFSTAGSWTVTATFTDAEGESDSEEWEVTVNIDPSVSIVSPSSPVSIYSGDSQTFTASASDSDNNLKSYEWFVDGTSEDDHTWLILPTGTVTEDFTHTFSTAGPYKVKVTFTDAVGDSDSEEWTVNVRDAGSPSVSRVSPSTPVSLDTGDSQTFRASAEDDDDDLSKWKWEAKRDRIGPDFVYTPGEQSFSTSPTGSVTKEFSYTFSTAGDWTVTATFTDAEGESDSEEWEVTVNIDPSVSIVSPSSPVSIYSGDSQTFTASASDSDNNLKSYEWFVDGTSEDDHTWLILPTGTVTEDFTHTFSTAGPYKVKVTFTDAVGDSDSEEWTVNVRDAGSPSVSRVSPSTPVSLDTGDSQTFRASAEDDDDDLSKWKWEAKRDRIGPDFVYTPGEQSFSTSPTASVTKDFTYTFSTAGDWTVKVTFTDSEGLSDSEEWEVNVSDPVVDPNVAPAVSIVSPSTPVDLNTGDSQTFTASASDSDNNLKRYEWFVDGTSEDDGSWQTLPTGTVTRSFTHTFSTAGTYTMKVTFTDSDGASDSVSWESKRRRPQSEVPSTAPSVSSVSPSSSSVSSWRQVTARPSRLMPQTQTTTSRAMSGS